MSVDPPEIAVSYLSHLLTGWPLICGLGGNRYIRAETTRDGPAEPRRQIHHRTLIKADQGRKQDEFRLAPAVASGMALNDHRWTSRVIHSGATHFPCSPWGLTMELGSLPPGGRGLRVG